MPAAAAATALPDLSRLSSTSVPSYRVQVTIPLDPEKEVIDVKTDGNCLYSCLLALREESSPWMGTDQRYRVGCEAFKGMVKNYFVENYDDTFRSHWASELKSQPGCAELSPKQRVVEYASGITSTRWGGDLEIDVAAHMFGVVINKFERDTRNVPGPEARLVASFHGKGDKGNRAPRWNLVLKDGHFNYVIPEPPLGRGSQGQPPSAPQDASGDDTEAFTGLRRQRERLKKLNAQKPPPDTNTLLGKLAMERKKRKEREEQALKPEHQERQERQREKGGDCPGCSDELAPAPLEQRQQIEDDAALAAVLEKIGMEDADHALAELLAEES